MNTLSPSHFQLLKNEVLQVAGVKNVTTADCRVISLCIHQATNQLISETTLKRIFGFVLSKFNPSQYTINLLAIYCGYTGWKDFCDKKEHGYVEVTNEDIDWHVLKKNAAAVTDFTLQALKNRSGVPFGQTIPRRFLKSHMDEFIASDSRGTVLAGPAGYGKSIALCHWVDEKVKTDVAENNDDIVLFFSSHALMSALHSGTDPVNWLLALLGYSVDKDLRALATLSQKKGAKFFIVIDGFDPCLLRNDHFNLWLSLLSDIFTMHAPHHFFKLVLTMRSATWINNRGEWEDEKYTWFANLTAANNYANVPLLSCNEISELRGKINPADNTAITLSTAQALNRPIYFQYFYKQHKADFTLKHLDNLAVYDIAAAFVANKIYLCLNSSEKIALVIGIVEQMDLASGNYSVSKLKVNCLLKQNASVYQDLLSTGIFKEINNSDNYHYDNIIKFNDDNILDYFIALTLLQNNNNRFNARLVQSLGALLNNNSRKLQVLKWCIIDAVKTGRQNDLSVVTDIALTVNEKAGLINFIGDLLKKESANAKGGAPAVAYFKNDHSEKLFDYFFGLELINTEYKATLINLLGLDLTDRQKIMVYTALGTISIIQLDMNSLEGYLQQLAKYPDDAYYSFPVNPLSCLDAIFHYLKYGFIKRDALVELTKVAFALAGKEMAPCKKSAVNDMLFLLSVYTLTLNDNPKKTLRFIDVLNNFYCNQEPHNNDSPYHFLMTLQRADAQYKLNNHTEVAKLYELLANRYTTGEGQLTPFMKALFFSLKIKLFVNKNEEAAVASELKYVNAISEHSGNKFPRVYILMLLLRNSNFITEHPAFKKQAGHEYNMILNKSGIDRERFPI